MGEEGAEDSEMNKMEGYMLMVIGVDCCACEVVGSCDAVDGLL
jgi:hypothetical protein